MLSILIPTYNYDCTQLVMDLRRQAKDAAIRYEIIVMDDASATCKEANQDINNLPHCQYIELAENIGRSRIRNRLADMAKYNSLLFMDCDAAVCKSDFISAYLPYCKNQSQVVIGGTAYDPNETNPAYSLRLTYGLKREGNQNYGGCFTTFNFMIPHKIFNLIRFDENIHGYGHEDTLFGIRLIEKQIPIIRINNPLIHKGLDTNKIFLQKTEIANANLLKLYRETKQPELPATSKLLRTYLNLPTHIHWFIGIAFRLFRPLMTKQLCSKRPSLFLFDCYKLGHLCSLKQ